MYFEDLSDDIIADDWLIPPEELTRRRLIRRTAHYTIYKADWFGDVLVYEPRPSADSSAGAAKKSASSSAGAEANWFELNELRLVAHENFILFMGASMHDEYNGENSSLVMEMLKPNSVSLFNLLHAAKSQPASPLNR